MKKAKMDRFSKFKILFALKLNFNGGQFYKEIAIVFGYFIMLENQNKFGKTLFSNFISVVVWE